MARLSSDQVQAILQAPRNGADIAACMRHEERIQLHAVPCVDGDLPPAGLKRLLKRWEARLPKDKYEKMVQHIEWPLATTDLAETVFTGLSRVFDAQDGLVQVELAGPEVETDFEQYRTTIGEDDFWSTAAFRAVCTAPHSVLVIDMAAEQQTARPEPYVFLASVSELIDIDLRADGVCEYLVLALPERREGEVRIQRAAVYDDGFYRILEKPQGQEQWVLVLENAHILGHCPARLLYNRPLDQATRLPRRGPLTKQLGKLDDFIWWDAAIAYYNSYGVFPVWWAFAEECGFTSGEGQACQNGVVQFVKGHTTVDGREVPQWSERPCPACAAKSKLIGPGTVLEVPTPNPDRGDTRHPAGTVSADPEILRYIQEVQQWRERQIVAACLGTDNEPQNAQAKNQDQVRAGFESKTDVLSAFKRPLEEARQWALLTLGILRYGAQQIRSAYVNMGEQWYLKTPEQLAQQETAARAAGRPVYELSAARDQRYQTEYRTNPAQLDRMRILSDLEPFPEYSLEQIGNLLEQQPAVFQAVFTPRLVALKADFGRYLTRFESEQLPVTRFGMRVAYHEKLQAITQILLSYVPEIQPVGSDQEGGSAGAAA